MVHHRHVPRLRPGVGEAALDRGDRVAATARDTATLDDLVEKYGEAVLPLSSTSPTGRRTSRRSRPRTGPSGSLDVVVNNAGYGHFGFVEELTEDEIRAQMETNLFGALWVTQAALPILRAQGSGHIIQVSSIGGISAFPGIGAYHASKWALEGLSQALAAEVAGFGVKVTLVEPGGFATDWAGPSSKRSESLPAYAEARETMDRERKARAGSGGPGDPRASAAALLRIVDSPEPPLRTFFGNTPIDIAKADYARRIATWEQWDDVAKLAQG